MKEGKGRREVWELELDGRRVGEREKTGREMVCKSNYLHTDWSESADRMSKRETSVAALHQSDNKDATTCFQLYKTVGDHFVVDHL